MAEGEDQEGYDTDDALALDNAVPKTSAPPKYLLILLNDDYTPMDFVILILQKFFARDYDQAHKIMMQIHSDGSAVCGIFTRDIAETKLTQVNAYARVQEHPLKCIMEPE